MIPGAKTLDRAFPGHGRELRALLAGTRKPTDYPATRAWVDRCYHAPSRAEQVMFAANELVNGYGTEVIRGRYVNDYHGDIQAEYVNLGDPYILTLLHDHETSRYHIVCWGDWVEANERKRQLH